MNTKKLIGTIIGVTAFIILIAGATFAFFSAQGGSANNAIRANATTLANLGFVSSNSKVATNLVPVHSESSYFSRYPGTSASGEHSCKDDVGNEICSVYEFTITNSASVAQTIYVSLVPKENTFDNLYFAAFNTTAASADYTVATGSTGSGNNFTLTPQTTANNSTLGHQATKLTKNSTTAIDMPGLSVNLAANSSITYTVLVWLQDISAPQNGEQGGKFKAGINVTTGTNSIGVTGDLGGTTPIETGIYVVSSATMYIGQTIPNDVNVRTTAASAMADWTTISGSTKPFYLKHVLNENDEITESYVGFVVTPEMAQANQGMTAGTYYLRGGIDESSASETPIYDANISVLQSSFGSENCSDSSYYFSCNVDGLSAGVTSNGNVNVTDADDASCYIGPSIYGDSTCFD